MPPNVDIKQKCPKGETGNANKVTCKHGFDASLRDICINSENTDYKECKHYFKTFTTRDLNYGGHPLTDESGSELSKDKTVTELSVYYSKTYDIDPQHIKKPLALRLKERDGKVHWYENTEDISNARWKAITDSENFPQISNKSTEEFTKNLHELTCKLHDLHYVDIRAITSYICVCKAYKVTLSEEKKFTVYTKYEHKYTINPDSVRYGNVNLKWRSSNYGDEGNYDPIRLNSDHIHYLSVYYWDEDRERKIPLLMEIAALGMQVSIANDGYNHNERWTMISDEEGLPKILTKDELEEKLKDLTCTLFKPADRNTLEQQKYINEYCNKKGCKNELELNFRDEKEENERGEALPRAEGQVQDKPEDMDEEEGGTSTGIGSADTPKGHTDPVSVVSEVIGDFGKKLLGIVDGAVGSVLDKSVVAGLTTAVGTAVLDGLKCAKLGTSPKGTHLPPAAGASVSSSGSRSPGSSGTSIGGGTGSAHVGHKDDKESIETIPSGREDATSVINPSFILEITRPHANFRDPEEDVDVPEHLYFPDYGDNYPVSPVDITVESYFPPYELGRKNFEEDVHTKNPSENAVTVDFYLPEALAKEGKIKLVDLVLEPQMPFDIVVCDRNIRNHEAIVDSDESGTCGDDFTIGASNTDYVRHIDLESTFEPISPFLKSKQLETYDPKMIGTNERIDPVSYARSTQVSLSASDEPDRDPESFTPSELFLPHPPLPERLAQKVSVTSSETHGPGVQPHGTSDSNTPEIIKTTISVPAGILTTSSLACFAGYKFYTKYNGDPWVRHGYPIVFLKNLPY
ncbi:hypothetical protein BEWA_035940 [Theileria equi strain WA]|uniref:Uncharacterized protein n=1 Tax=Theileria equi strain WA TaxID=1537102 RepID=L1LEF7_THEEQ|nr:hypothetical protein BEWA_035940 [Theileria equi strain WA]EKX73558.1 hypothetical protein BEWA_035940 [Theileria equi strain WA]|eukprot:XP_004833010.1 hypothetical protein BEWA_035940 [Theileria equi strain WA]